MQQEENVYMNEKFFDLSREKQDRMINGALEDLPRMAISMQVPTIW